MLGSLRLYVPALKLADAVRMLFIDAVEKAMLG